MRGRRSVVGTFAAMPGRDSRSVARRSSCRMHDRSDVVPNASTVVLADAILPA
jgi:hypothetical protein